MTQQFTASEVRERERFEEWYTTHAFNYSRDPIGSRDCSLQWESWKAALAALKARMKPCARVRDGEVHVYMDTAHEGKEVAVVVVEE